jgi:hypothetical protein
MGKPKKIAFQLISPDDPSIIDRPHDILAEVRAENHFDTAAAKIALAWKKGIKPDADMRVVLGFLMRATDLQRELIDYDFVIVLNREVWEDPEFTQAQKRALLDHEMCHAARCVDEDGKPWVDVKGRPVWRTRSHDIEEFDEIVARHGCYKRDLERFAKTIISRKNNPLLATLPEAQP